VPDILAELATVDARDQTSGNCIRNITADHFAGIAADEIIDPLPYSELVRQWASFHPEFSYLPRKFKIALSGSATDRAATLVHDIGVHALRDNNGQIGFRILVGGGLGRTPVIGHVIREFLREESPQLPRRHPARHNRFGRRDNIYKARVDSGR
jgi:sulfite reductase (NADPH) hemoprotein beta-component